jgi:hypothetical protein
VLIQNYLCHVKGSITVELANGALLGSGNQDFQAAIASGVGTIADMGSAVNNVLQGLRLSRFLEEVAQWSLVKLSVGLSSRVQ